MTRTILQDEFRKMALRIKLRRALNMSRGQLNPDWDKAHPDFVRDHNSKNDTLIKKYVKDNCESAFKDADHRKEKLWK